MEMHEIYTKAAKEVHNRPAQAAPGACFAIRIAGPTGDYGNYPTWGRCIERMEEMYGPDAARSGRNQCWWACNFGAPEGCNPEDDSVKYDLKEVKECRVLMLLFLAAMAEAGDL